MPQDAPALTHWSDLDLEAATRAASEELERGRGQESDERTGDGLVGMSAAYAAIGRSAEACALGEEAVKLSVALPETHDVWASARSALAWASLLTGEFARSRELHEELLERSRRLGNAPAAAPAYAGLAAEGLLLLDPDAAVERAEAGGAVAADPLSGAACLCWKSTSLWQARRYPEARAALDSVFGAPAEARGAPLRALSGAVAIFEGDLARGMQALLAALEQSRRTEHRLASVLIGALLGETYVRLADREAGSGVKVMLASPGFAARHALPAARNAHRVLEIARKEMIKTGSFGLNGLLAFSLARLHARQGRRDPARSELRTCVEFLQGAGRSELPPRVRELHDRLGGASY
jgi:tetratricopeptide (TPR) repeat protein